MPLLLYNPVPGEKKGRVYLVHYQPEMLPEHLRQKGVWVDEIPAPPLRTAETADSKPVLYVNPETGEVWHEFEARTQSRPER